MSAIGDGPSLLVVVSRVRGIGPGMVILAHLAITKEVVQQNESLGQRVMVGRDFASENSEPWIAIAARFVAQHLIVGPIFLDDVQHMVDRRSHSHLSRDYGFHRRRRGARKLLVVI